MRLLGQIAARWAASRSGAETVRNYPLPATLYIAAVIAAGATLASSELFPWRSANPTKYGLYLVAFLLVSGLKIRLPRITGTMSVNEVFIYLGLIELSLPEILLMGCLGGAVQTIWQARDRPRPDQVLFNVACMVLAVSASYSAFHARVPGFGDLHLAVALLAAACAFFLVNTLLVALVIGFTERQSPVRLWWNGYFWSFPYYLLGASLAGGFSAANAQFGWQASLLLLPPLFVVYRSYNLYVERLESEKIHAENVADLHLRTIEALVAAIEAKDETTHDHLERVQVYAVELGKQMRLDESELQALRVASVLHDIGKLGVPAHIISKPGRLTPAEFEKMKIHPVVGAEIVERVRFPYPVAPIVRHHHEKWNGMGYPDGLSGESIPIGARILAAIDCLDALASDRQYRKALPLDEAMQVVASEAGKSYDPRIVEALQPHYKEWEKLVGASPPARERLDTHIEVERGEAPGAGYERESDSAAGPLSTPAARRAQLLQSIAFARAATRQVYELSREPGSTLSLPDLLSVLDGRLQGLISYDSFCVYVQNRASVDSVYTRGTHLTESGSHKIPVGEGLSGWVAENHKPIVNGNPEVEVGYLGDRTRSFTLLRSALAAPLEGPDGMVGVLTLYHGNAFAFSTDDLRILQAIAPRLAMLIANVSQDRRAVDPGQATVLENAPNSESLLARLDAELVLCAGDQQPLSVMVLDLNNHRRGGSRSGNRGADRESLAAIEQLRQRLGELDYVARIGTEGLAILLPGCDRSAAERKASAVAGALRTAGYPVGDTGQFVGSIGIATYPVDGDDATTLLAAAERRMGAAGAPCQGNGSSSIEVASLAEHVLAQRDGSVVPPEFATHNDGSGVT